MEYDLEQGKQLKLEGMERAAVRRRSDLEIAREIAKKIALSRVSRRCTSDMVRRELSRDYGIESLGNATGSLFKTRDWTFTGDFVQSKLPSNHARIIRVWEYVGKGI